MAGNIKIHRFIFFLTFFLGLLFLPCKKSFAQFTGNFEIERHYLDLENFLDWKAYQPPIDWRYEWSVSPNGLFASVGSISMYEFYYLNEIRFGFPIGSYTTFYFQQFEESFYSKEPVYQEVEFRFGKQYGISIIGNPPHDKKYGHQGYALSYGYRHTNNNIRVSLLDQYFLYNEKNANTEKNSKDETYIQTPTLKRLQAQYYWDNRIFLQVDVKQVTTAELEKEDPLINRQFYSNSAKVTLDWKSSHEWLIGVMLFSNQEFREQTPETISQDLPDLKQNLSLNWLDFYYNSQLDETNKLTLGTLFSGFKNEISSSLEEHDYICDLTTLQAYSIWQLRKSDWFHWRFSLQAGQAEIEKDYIGIDESLDEKNLEMKAGVGIIMQEEENYRLFINTTWDLDIFTTRQWDGGNIQLQKVF